MKPNLRLSNLLAIAMATVIIAGCASDSGSKSSSASKPDKKAEKEARKAPKVAAVANPSKVKFSEFKSVELKETTLAAKHANNKGNQESARRMDDMLLQQVKSMFGMVKVVPKDTAFGKPAERTLQITPHIQEIRLITTGSRIWLGAMAGGSSLLMQVTYQDSSTGEMVASPTFYVDSNAWAGGWSMGAADNRLRDEIVQQIVTYTTANK